jgi:hypothetical protein
MSTRALNERCRKFSCLHTRKEKGRGCPELAVVANTTLSSRVGPVLTVSMRRSVVRQTGWTMTVTVVWAAAGLVPVASACYYHYDMVWYGTFAVSNGTPHVQRYVRRQDATRATIVNVVFGNLRCFSLQVSPEDLCLC